MNPLFAKFREVFFSVLPVTLIVVATFLISGSLTVLQLERFAVGAAFLIVGLSIFLIGVDIGVAPLGENIGVMFAKSNRLTFVVPIALVLGFFVSFAEPDLQILALQVQTVTNGQIDSTVILCVVSLGIAVMLALGFCRIVYNFPLYIFLCIAYGLILLLSIFTSDAFLAVAFDASGATTGALTVPFVLALTIGVSALKKDSKASEKDSFGLVAVVSTGAIISVLTMGIFKNISEISGVLQTETDMSDHVLSPFLRALPEYFIESCLALSPLVILFIIFNVWKMKLSRKLSRRIIFGMIYSLVGLTLFLTGVNAGFMSVGSALGQWIGQTNKILPVLFGMVMGVVTILAEPAVHVLTRQIETVTAGYVKSGIIIAALAIGAGLAVSLSIVRVIVPWLKLWHYLLPGYIIALSLSFICPKLFVGIAFDSGGVASGPMTATFILAFTQGVANAVPGADVLKDAFGMIALVAMMPIITLEVLGIIYKIKTLKRQV